MAGNWALIMLAFVVSDHVDIEPFLKTFQSSAIWSEAGFDRVPSVPTAWNRLTELEQVSCAFIDAANKLIGRATELHPQIGEVISVDGSGFETNARLERDCPDSEQCKARGGNPPRWQSRATNELVKETRHEEAADAEDANLRSDLVGAAEANPTARGRRRRGYRHFWLGPRGQKHRYRTLDPDAGCRRYSGGRQKTWLGGLFQPAASLFLDAPVAINVIPANHQENEAWPVLLEKTTAALGRRPEAVAMDRHYSIRAVFEFNTRKGIDTVSPWRKPHQDIEREDVDTDRWDHHGVPRCQHCGGPGFFEEGQGLGFYIDARRQPRIRFTCQLRMTAACGGTQSIACEEEWRLLTPLSRRSERYHAIADAGKSLEHIFHHWRDRYQVAGNNPDTRPRRPGMAWQELRASAALLVEWIFLSLRHGWLGSHRRRNGAAPKLIHGRRRLGNVLRARRRHGLDLPYGEAAINAGFAPAAASGSPPTPF